MFTNTARGTMLDAVTLSHLGAHSAYPGHTGASELSGGIYARIAATVNAATGTPPTRSLNAAASIPIPSGSTVRWIVAWNALTSGVSQAVSPNGGSPKEFLVDVAADKILAPAHGYADTQKVVYYGGASAPGGLTLGTVYFVRDSTTNDYKVAATSGGTAIDLTSAASNDCLMSVIVEEVFAADGSLQVNTPTTFAINS